MLAMPYRLTQLLFTFNCYVCFLLQQRQYNVWRVSVRYTKHNVGHWWWNRPGRIYIRYTVRTGVWYTVKYSIRWSFWRSHDAVIWHSGGFWQLVWCQNSAVCYGYNYRHGWLYFWYDHLLLAVFTVTSSGSLLIHIECC